MFDQQQAGGVIRRDLPDIGEDAIRDRIKVESAVAHGCGIAQRLGQHALIPVGGEESLNASQAAEVVSLLEPHIVIPMHYHVPDVTMSLDPVGKFLKEMGLDKVAPQESLKVSRSGLPDETQIVLLELKSKDEA